MILEEYSNRIRPLDRLAETRDVRLGLFGEVGSVLATAKKKSRDGMSYDYMSAVTEELGDTAWYLFRLMDRLGFSIANLIDEHFSEATDFVYTATDISSGPVSRTPLLGDVNFNAAVCALADAAANLLKERSDREQMKSELQQFFVSYVRLVKEIGIDFSSILKANLEKTEGRFLLPDLSALPTFDEKFEDDERIPDDFSISIIERKNGKAYLKWNGVFIGDPLTDNIEKRDGYRFHDVFHMAYAAILHWSPTFRALIRHKRKSDPKCDEEQDSGRAIVIEEGLSAWIFSIAKGDKFFLDRDHLSFDLLKGVRQFVSGYEVEECPLSLWERAILEGYRVFRELTTRKTGVIIGNRRLRSIEFRRE
ncbi:pyrophosphatase [Ralstonia solanacearum]|uniref:pyrophosphatase n=1 Tax=Ralstonia solanacearum TaxID=305 RepID=UPI001FF905C4|nr:pyrophosphatase [Ralstonia solanacearum]MDB0527792.1 pyrophosphatase [Ralstonia solanacearum]